MLPELGPVPIDEADRHTLLDEAAAAAVLFVADLHGTRQIPAVLVDLAPELSALGYAGLGLEMPPDQGEPLRAWADGTTDIPPFFAGQPSDGRESLEVLALVRAVRRAGWHVFAFDANAGRWQGTWADRDRGMAESLAAQCAALPASTRVVALCGAAHAQLAADPHLPPEFWPSCAANLGALIGAEHLRSIRIVFHGGTFYNLNRVRKSGSIPWPWADETAHVTSCADGGFSLELHLPRCSAASFAAPSGPRFVPMYLHRARLAAAGPDATLRPVRFFSILLAGDGRAPGVTLFLTPKGKVACHEVGARGEREGDVLRVFNSVAEAAASGRYRKGLMEQAYAEAEAVGQQEVEIDDDLRCQLARAQDAELLDV